MMTESQWTRFARTFGTDWRKALRLAAAVGRGTWYALFFRVFRSDVAISLPFIAYVPVRIVGPGRVRIGPYCSVHRNVQRSLTVVTLSPSAEVWIGARCSLGGLTIRCRNRVVLGERAMTAHSLVQDTVLFSDSPRGSRGSAAAFSAPIDVGQNAWLGGYTVVLAGTTVGDDSVLAWGAACFDTVVPPASLASGSPATRTIPVGRLQEFGRTVRELSASRSARLAL
jgi:acetyltransferase-like isoleucine patch superfamily enzyme